MEAGADFPESNHEAMADMVSRGGGAVTVRILKFTKHLYRVVQLNLTPEIEVLFDRSLSIFSMASIKQHMVYFTFQC